MKLHTGPDSIIVLALFRSLICGLINYLVLLLLSNFNNYFHLLKFGFKRPKLYLRNIYGNNNPTIGTNLIHCYNFVMF